MASWMEDRRAPFAVLLLFAVLSAVNLGLPELSDTDESRSGCIVRDMAEGGHWLLPRTPDGYLSEKPPAYYGAAAALGLVLGVNEWTLRSVSWVAGLGTLALTCVLGSLIGGRRAGTISMLVLAANGVFLGCARTARVDMVLAFFIAAGMAACLAGRTGRLGPRVAAILAGAAWGGAVLTKGPVGAAVPGVALAAEVLVETRGRFWKGIAWGPAFLGAGTLALVAGAYYVPALALGGREFLETSILSENFYMPIGQARGLGVSHRQPFHFYFGRQLGILLPAFPFLPALVGRRGDGPPARAWLRPLVWAGAGFLVFMAAANKRTYYLLPLQPFIAAAIGVAASREIDAEPRAWKAAPAAILGALLAAGGMFLPFSSRFLRFPLSVPMLGVAAVLAVFSGLALLKSCRGGFRAVASAFAALAIAAAAVPGLLVDTVKAAGDRTRAFVAEARGRLPSGAVPVVSGRLCGYAVDFYWPERLPREPAAGSDAPYILVNRGYDRRWERLGEVLAVWRCKWPDEETLLVRRRR